MIQVKSFPDSSIVENIQVMSLKQPFPTVLRHVVRRYGKIQFCLFGLSHRCVAYSKRMHIGF